MLITRYYYDDTLTPVLESDGGKDTLAKGEQVNLPLSPETYCTGFSQGKRRVACPKNAHGRKQCGFCQKEDDWLTCLRCDGSTCLQINPDLKEDCFGREYVVYLASFGKDVKAGISKKERVRKRWVEQGADFACVVFEGVNGQTARLIESDLFRKGLLSRLTLNQKMAFPKADEDAISKILKTPGFQNLQARFSEKATGIHVESLQEGYPSFDDAKATEHLQGKVLGFKGPLLLLEQNGKRVFPLPSAVGKKVLKNTLASYF